MSCNAAVSAPCNVSCVLLHGVAPHSSLLSSLSVLSSLDLSSNITAAARRIPARRCTMRSSYGATLASLPRLGKLVCSLGWQLNGIVLRQLELAVDVINLQLIGKLRGGIAVVQLCVDVDAERVVVQMQEVRSS